MSSAPDEFAGCYATEAVESGVLDADREEIGHVGLFDLDDVGAGVARDVAERLPGPAAILRSSPASYHVWSLAVDDLDTWLDRADDLRGVDVEHVALSERRGCGVARIAPKIEIETGDETKPAPTLRAIERSDTDLPLSAPHLRVLRDEFDASPLDLGASPADCAGSEWVGHSLDRRTFIADVGGR